MLSKKQIEEYKKNIDYTIKHTPKPELERKTREAAKDGEDFWLKISNNGNNI